MSCPCLNPRKRRNPARRRNATLQVVMPNGRSRCSLCRRASPYIRDGRCRTCEREALRGLSPEEFGAALQYLKRKNPAIRGYAGRGGARVRGGQNLTNPRFVSASYARTFPGFAKALSGFKRFHGYAPSHFTVTRIKTSGPANTRRAVFMVGEAPAIEYRTWRYAKSKKSHTKDGRRILWRHKMGELGGKVPYWVHDPVSGVTSALGGTYKVTDFYRH